jgi:Dyp-type peroxidase family
MVAGPLAVEGSPPPDSWRLEPACAALTQGLLVSPFGHLEAGLALFLALPDKAGGGWLAALRAVVPITDASGKVSPCAAVAFTCAGLAAMGLDRDALSTFSEPFTEGMFQADRRRRLGDLEPLVIPNGPVWGGGGIADAAAFSVVHAVLLIYADADAAAAAIGATARGALAARGVSVIRQIAMSLMYDAQGIAREHFGFADGISQPAPFGEAIQTPTGAPMPRDPWHGVAAGDVLMGHVDAHGEPAPGPLVKATPGPATNLPQGNAPDGFRDLGLNGSYLVIRELRQDVSRFWLSMDQAAADLADAAIDSAGLAERLVGRTMDGDVLSPGGPLPPSGGEPQNSLGYLARDPHGFGCPMGSHIRRANPRDGLAPTPGLSPTLLHAANNHRLMRRGRKYGPPIADPRVDDGQDRGLLFMALNTDLARQFEFVQQNWLLNQTFAVLFDETDPLLGPKGPFTLPATPLRRRAQVETYIQLVGGEYFFLPSLPALDYLESLP